MVRRTTTISGRIYRFNLIKKIITFELKSVKKLDNCDKKIKKTSVKVIVTIHWELYELEPEQGHLNRERKIPFGELV
jgi:hypothetical protein